MAKIERKYLAHFINTATACPGPYLKKRFASIASTVNARLDAAKPVYRVQVGAFVNKANAEKMLQKLEAAGFNGFVLEGKV